MGPDILAHNKCRTWWQGRLRGQVPVYAGKYHFLLSYFILVKSRLAFLRVIRSQRYRYLSVTLLHLFSICCFLRSGLVEGLQWQACPCQLYTLVSIKPAGPQTLSKSSKVHISTAVICPCVADHAGKCVLSLPVLRLQQGGRGEKGDGS